VVAGTNAAGRSFYPVQLLPEDAKALRHSSNVWKNPLKTFIDAGRAQLPRARGVPSTLLRRARSMRGSDRGVRAHSTCRSRRTMLSVISCAWPTHEHVLCRSAVRDPAVVMHTCAMTARWSLSTWRQPWSVIAARSEPPCRPERDEIDVAIERCVVKNVPATKWRRGDNRRPLALPTSSSMVGGW